MRTSDKRVRRCDQHKAALGDGVDAIGLHSGRAQGMVEGR